MPQSRTSQPLLLLHVILLGVLCIRGSQLYGQSSEAIQLVIYPADEVDRLPMPTLLPPITAQTAGNAAVAYRTVHAEAEHVFGSDELNQLLRVAGTQTLEELGRQPRLRELVADGPHIDSLIAAARCESVDWQIPIRQEPYLSLFVPETQQGYQFGQVVAARARYAIIDHDLDKALSSIQASLALAKHYGDAPTIQHALTGLALQQLAHQVLRDFVSQPHAPNLYWSLTALPQPLVKHDAAVAAARCQLELTFPWLLTVLEDDLSAEQWNVRLETVVELFRNMRPRTKLPTVDEMFVWGYPLAKQRLIDGGVPLEKVEEMPVAQVLLADFHRQDKLHSAAVLRWVDLPYWVAYPRVAEEQAKQKANIGFTLDALTSVTRFDYTLLLQSKLNTEQQIAMLRCVEAMRMVAAKTGELPATLADVEYPPIPLDPASGKAFAYTRRGDTAVLEGIATVSWVTTRWEVKLARLKTVDQE